MARPEFLYRGSPTKHAEKFVPKERITLGDVTSLFVLATSEKVEASKFIVPTESLNVLMDSVDGVHFYLCANEDQFRELDQGGTIYVFSVEGFECRSDIGKNIWASSRSVAPISREEFSSGLEAMAGMGVQVLFISEEEIEQIRASENRGEEIKLLFSKADH